MKRYHSGGGMVEILRLSGYSNGHPTFEVEAIVPSSGFVVDDYPTRVKGVEVRRINRFDEVETPAIEHKPDHRRPQSFMVQRPQRELKSDVLSPMMPALYDAGYTVIAHKDNTFVCRVCDVKKLISYQSQVQAADGSEFEGKAARSILRLKIEEKPRETVIRSVRGLTTPKPWRTASEFACVCTKCANLLDDLQKSEDVSDVKELKERVGKASRAGHTHVGPKTATGRRRKAPEPDEYGNVFYGSYGARGKFKAEIVRAEDVEAYHRRESVSLPASLLAVALKHANRGFTKARIGSRTPRFIGPIQLTA